MTGLNFHRINIMTEMFKTKLKNKYDKLVSKYPRANLNIKIDSTIKNKHDCKTSHSEVLPKIILFLPKYKSSTI